MIDTYLYCNKDKLSIRAKYIHRALTNKEREKIQPDEKKIYRQKKIKNMTDCLKTLKVPSRKKNSIETFYTIKKVLLNVQEVLTYFI